MALRKGEEVSDRVEPTPPTSGPQTDAPESAAERQLYLLDQVIGLRAQLAEEVVRNQARLFKLTAEQVEERELLHQAQRAATALRVELTQSGTQIERLNAELHETRLADARLRVELLEAVNAQSKLADRVAAVQASRAFRLGHAVLRPAALARRLARRLRSS